MELQVQRNPSSFRDPSGFIYEQDGTIYRQVNLSFQKDFDHFLNSGYYDYLVDKKQLTPHIETDWKLADTTNCYKTLIPQKVPFISYAWEWSFSMLKDAALLTLDLQESSMKYGLSLKDASTYNIQFYQGRPLLIDSLSFELYLENKPWVAYRQFCEQFLAPLILMHYSKSPLQALSLAYPEGIPLDITASLLPFRSKLSIHCYLHIHLNARVKKNTEGDKDKAVLFSRKKMENLIRSLRLLVESLKLNEKASNWSAYYEEASTRNNYLPDKKQIVREWIEKIFREVDNASDLGANDGVFSRLFTEKGIECLAVDLDPACIDRLYRNIKKEGIKQIHPLIQDISNPSPGVGLNNKERTPFLERAKRDAVIALAIIHHLAIGKNIPLEKIAELFAGICKKYLIIEFVPEEDEKVQFMLKQKTISISGYDENSFEMSFSKYFNIVSSEKVKDSIRRIYLLERK